MSNSTEVAEIQKKDLEFIDTLDNFEHLETAAQGNETIMTIQKTQYAGIDIDATFTRMVLASELINLARSAAGDQPCSAQILLVMSQYQTVTKECQVLSKVFVDSCTRAVKLHKMIKKMFLSPKKEQNAKAFTKFGELAQLAMALKGSADKMTLSVKGLVEKAEKALIAAQSDKTTNAEQKKQIQKLIDEAKAREAALTASVNELGRMINDAKEEEDKHEKTAKTARDRMFGLQLAGSIMGGLSQIASAAGPMIAAGATGGASSMMGAVTGAVGNLANQGGQGAPPHGSQAPQAPQGGSGAEMAAQTAMMARLQAASVERTKEVTVIEEKLKAAKASEDKDTKEGKDRIAALEDELKKATEEKSKASEDLTKAADSQAPIAATADEKAAAAAAHRRQLQAKRAEDKAALAKDVEALKTMRTEKTEIEQVILSLGSCIRALGQVKTTFEQVAMFWDMVSKHCHKLSLVGEDIKEWWECDEEFSGDVELEWQRSAAGWAALGSVNIQAWRAMCAAGQDIDEKMANLKPVQHAEVQRLAEKIQLSLKDADF
jgi:hypothetical protein